MFGNILACGLTDQLRRRSHLEHIVKTHADQGVEHNVHIVQVIKLAVQ